MMSAEAKQWQEEREAQNAARTAHNAKVTATCLAGLKKHFPDCDIKKQVYGSGFELRLGKTAHYMLSVSPREARYSSELGDSVAVRFNGAWRVNEKAKSAVCKWDTFLKNVPVWMQLMKDTEARLQIVDAVEASYTKKEKVLAACLKRLKVPEGLLESSSNADGLRLLLEFRQASTCVRFTKVPSNEELLSFAEGVRRFKAASEAFETLIHEFEREQSAQEA